MRLAGSWGRPEAAWPDSPPCSTVYRCPTWRCPSSAPSIRRLDVYWDNPLADWMVHTEITQCRTELERAIHQVRHVMDSLEQRSAELSSDLAVR